MFTNILNVKHYKQEFNFTQEKQQQKNSFTWEEKKEKMKMQNGKEMLEKSSNGK